MKLTTPPNKNFKTDIEIICSSLLNKENISFSKFCDGEWAVIQNRSINNKEFWFDPNKDQIKREALIKAIKYKNSRYFVGITCTKVFGLDIHRAIKQLSDQNEDHLTWADIFVNSNYPYYLNHFIPIYQNRTTVLICNERAKLINLPFQPHKVFTVGNNAWHTNWNLIDELKKFIDDSREKNIIFLFCCGPFGNILSHQLTEYCEDHSYLDIGSTLNIFLQSAEFDREYYLGNNYFSNMIGGWDQ